MDGAKSDRGECNGVGEISEGDVNGDEQAEDAGVV